MKKIRIFSLLLVLISSSSWAQDSNSLDWKITPYLWMVGIDGAVSIGPIDQDLDISFSDILSDFEIGGSVYGELGKGNHAVHIDYTYLRLRPDPNELPSPPFPMDSTLETKMTINIFEPAYNYRFNGLNSTSLVLGARYMDIEMRMTPNVDLPNLPPGLIPDRGALTAGPNWWDYFIGVKTHNKISTNWDFEFYGTVGTGGSDLPWTLQVIFGRRFSNDNRLDLGFRTWNIDYSNNEGILNKFSSIDARFYGFMVGYQFN